MSPAEVRWAELVAKSGLFTHEQIRALLDRLHSDGLAAVLASEQALAEKFVEAGLLTRWQVGKLLEGKFKGFRLGSYKLLEPIDAGAYLMFLAEHTLLRLRRVVQVLPPDRALEPTYLDPILLGARAAAALEHPNLVRLYDFDGDGTVYYLVLEYVEGTDLEARVAAEGPLPPATALEYFRQAARGLAYAHETGLIHRDIRPTNLVADERGTVKIRNLGLADISAAEHRPGAADFLAPEQAINGHAVDARADLYSLGCTFYFALTGHPPFPSGTIAERLLAHQLREPASIAEYRPDVPEEIVAIVNRMMAKKAEERFESAVEFGRALERVGGQ